MNRRHLLTWLMLLGVAFLVFQFFVRPATEGSSIDYSAFINDVDQGAVAKVTIDNYRIDVVLKNGQTYYTNRPAISDPKLIDDLISNGVQIVGLPPESPSLLLQIFVSLLPVLIIVGALAYFYRQQSGGKGSGPFSFGQSKAKRLTEAHPTISFDDVAGAESAKTELAEIVEFLKHPGRFQTMGAKIPKGALLSGPPGTGKTLLARAVAGEAKTSFFYVSGSDFVEMFVGVGASRVRDMFNQAKKSAPCILFIDEIDAVGRKRGEGHGGGNDEREQTLNQLLVEMDGFDAKSGVIIIAATNRSDVLDKALLRPGRFDRQIQVELPDLKGREAILNLHAKGVKLASDVRFKDLARSTPGFSGADLANLVNEAAIFAARLEHNMVTTETLEAAKDKIIMGAERSGDFMSPEEKELTAYHEAGHAIVGYYVQDYDELYKLTILPRGRALGVTSFLPERDRHSYTKRFWLSRLAVLFGGRMAEDIIFGKDKTTTGASHDIQQATNVARQMVVSWGYSESVGPLDYESAIGETPFATKPPHSEATLALIDSEIKRFISEGYEEASKILNENVDKLHLMAKVLLQKETIDREVAQAILEGRYEDEEEVASPPSSGPTKSTPKEDKKGKADKNPPFDTATTPLA